MYKSFVDDEAEKSGDDHSDEDDDEDVQTMSDVEFIDNDEEEGEQPIPMNPYMEKDDDVEDLDAARRRFGSMEKVNKKRKSDQSTTRNEIPGTSNEIPGTSNEIPGTSNEIPRLKRKKRVIEMSGDDEEVGDVVEEEVVEEEVLEEEEKENVRDGCDGDGGGGDDGDGEVVEEGALDGWLSPRDDEHGQEDAREPEREDLDRESRTFVAFKNNAIPLDVLDSFTDDHLEGVLCRLHTHFGEILRDDTGTDDLLVFFGLDLPGVHDATQRDMNAKLAGTLHLATCALFNTMQRRGLLSSQNAECVHNQGLFSKVLAAAKVGKQRLLNAVLVRQVQQAFDDAAPIPQMDVFSMQAFEPDKLSPMHKILLFMYEKTRVDNLRRYRNEAYAEVRLMVIEDDDGHEHFMTEEVFAAHMQHLQDLHLPQREPARAYHTHSWARVSGLAELVEASISKDTDMALWRIKTPGVVGSVVSALDSAMENDFRDLCPNYLVRSFRTGILDLGVTPAVFYSYREPKSIPRNLVACKFYEHDFDPTIMNTRHWFNIPTPTLDKILSKQLKNLQVRAITFAMLGRLLFPVNACDRWQVIPFIKGIANSGKSTIGRLAQKFFQTSDVAVMASNIEPMFGLDSLADKQMFICFEMTKHFGVSRSDFQSLISGEELQIAAKHKKSYKKTWTTPGILFGNEIGPWIDSAGSIARRIVLIEFMEPVTETDTTLEDRLDVELPAIIYKCHQAYKWLVNKCKGRGLWECLPRKFRHARDRIARQTNMYMQFFADQGAVKLVPGYPTTIRSVMAAFKVYFSGSKQHSESGNQEEFESGVKVIPGVSVSVSTTDGFFKPPVVSGLEIPVAFKKSVKYVWGIRLIEDAGEEEVEEDRLAIEQARENQEDEEDNDAWNAELSAEASPAHPAVADLIAELPLDYSKCFYDYDDHPAGAAAGPIVRHIARSDVGAAGPIVRHIARSDVGAASFLVVS